MHTARLFALPVLSGLLTAAALTEPAFAVAGFFALVPLFWFLRRATSKKAVFLGGWIHGTVLSAVLVKWILDFLPLDWAGFSKGSAAFFVAFSWSVTALALGLAWAILAVALAPLLLKRPPVAALGGAVVWIAGEFLSSWAVTTVWIGQNMTPYPVTLGHIGYALAEFPALLGLASFGTIYLLSAAAFLANFCAFFLLKNLRQAPRFAGYRTLAPAAGLLALLLAGTLPGKPFFLYGKEAATGRPLRVALVASNIPSWSEVKTGDVPAITGNLSRLLERLGREDLDLIVFPESSRVTNVVEGAALAEWFRDSDAVILDNALKRNHTFIEAPLSSRLVAFRPRDGAVIASWEKSHLMMAGEYAPRLLTWWAEAFGMQDILRRYQKNSYRPGPGNERPVPVGGQTVGISICTQGWAPQFFAQQRRLGATVLVNMSADALFHGSVIYPAERLAMLKVRAVENGSYLFHAANGNPSLVIGPDGSVRSELSLPAWLDYSYGVFAIPTQDLTKHSF